jgi:undecaprenyl pyrophosphate phosphatase UppP
MKVWKLIVGFILALIGMLGNMYIANFLSNNYFYLQIIGYIFIAGGVWFAATSAREDKTKNNDETKL